MGLPHEDGRGDSRGAGVAAASVVPLDWPLLNVLGRRVSPPHRLVALAGLLALSPALVPAATAPPVTVLTATQ